MKEHYHVILTVDGHDLCRLPKKFLTWESADAYAKRKAGEYKASGYRIENW